MKDLIDLLSQDDYRLGNLIVGRRWTKLEPDETFTSDKGKDYLYRWHVIPKNEHANIYLHIQVADDNARALHDHPWDNQSVILSGGYTEKYAHMLRDYDPKVRRLDTETKRTVQKGSVVQRPAEMAHCLLLPLGTRYTMTLFTTGPKRREWGFYTEKGWKPWHECLELTTGHRRSIWRG